MSKPPEVLNRHWQKPTPNSVYIGRPSKYKNNFSHLPNSSAKYKVRTRAEAVEAFARWIERLMEKYPDLRDEIIRDLGGRDLVCSCKPAACHGDILLKIANPNLGEKNESNATVARPDGQHPDQR